MAFLRNRMYISYQLNENKSLKSISFVDINNNLYKKHPASLSYKYQLYEAFDIKNYINNHIENNIKSTIAQIIDFSNHFNNRNQLDNLISFETNQKYK